MNNNSRRHDRFKAEGAISRFVALEKKQLRPFGCWLVDVSASGLGAVASQSLVPRELIVLSHGLERAVLRVVWCRPGSQGTGEYRIGLEVLSPDLDVLQILRNNEGNMGLIIEASR